MELGGGGLLSPTFRWLACAFGAGFVDIPEPALLLCILAADRFRDKPAFILLLPLLGVGVVGLGDAMSKEGTEEGFLGVSAGTSPGPNVAYISSISSSFGKGRTGRAFPLPPVAIMFFGGCVGALSAWLELELLVGGVKEVELGPCVGAGGVRGAGPGDSFDGPKFVFCEAAWA
jgi:hypothetical protein